MNSNRALAHEYGEFVYDRVEAPATRSKNKDWRSFTTADTVCGTGLRINPEHPNSGTWQRRADRRVEGDCREWMDCGAAVRYEDIYKIYAESFRGADHLHRILEEAKTIASAAQAAPTQ